MTHFPALGGLPPQPNVRRRYDLLSIAFHWLTLAGIIALFWSAWTREHAAGDGPARLLALHRTLGILVWLATVLRLAWKAGFAEHPPLPKAMGPISRIVAKVTHGMLYTLLLALPISGVLHSILRGKPFALLVGGVPELVARNKAAAHLFHDIHETGATMLMGLIGLHALAGLYHGLFSHDGVLGAMLPIPRQRPASQQIFEPAE